MDISYNFELHHVKRTNGEYPISIRITQSRRHKRRKTNVTVSNRKHFNPKAKFGKWVGKSDSEHAIKNNKLKKIHRGYENAEAVFENTGSKPSPSAILIQTQKRNTSSIIDFADHQHTLFVKKEQLNYAKHYKSIFKKLKNYALNELGQIDLLFSEINVSFLNEYEAYLASKGNRINTIGKNMKVIRAVINDAINEDLLPFEKNPFHKYSIKRENTHKVALNIKEIRNLEKVRLVKDTPLWHVRNYFLFSYYCAGIRAGDFIRLKWSNIVDGRLVYIMGKNNKIVNIKLNLKAISIIELYSTNKNKDQNYLFPLLPNSIVPIDKGKLLNLVNSKNVIINKHLRKLAIKVKIDRPLSFHIARHSFSDISRKKGADLYSISKALNHSNLRITEAYLASFDQEAADSLVDNL